MEAAVMTTPTVTGNQRSNDDVGDRIELGRYRTAAGVERVLYGQRVAKVVRVTDVPVKSPGRAYLVERGLEEDGYAALLRVGRRLSRHRQSARRPANVHDGLRIVARGSRAPTQAGRA
jgi:hypothetical protein